MSDVDTVLFFWARRNSTYKSVAKSTREIQSTAKEFTLAHAVIEIIDATGSGAKILDT